MTTTNTKYPVQYQKRIASKIVSGSIPATDISQQLNIPMEVLTQWVQEYLNNAPDDDKQKKSWKANSKEDRVLSNKSQQKCWTCIHSVPNKIDRGCPWSKRFEPVPGWNATPIIKKGELSTYCIQDCPQYVRD